MNGSWFIMIKVDQCSHIFIVESGTTLRRQNLIFIFYEKLTQSNKIDIKLYSHAPHINPNGKKFVSLRTMVQDMNPLERTGFQVSPCLIWPSLRTMMQDINPLKHRFLSCSMSHMPMKGTLIHDPRTNTTLFDNIPISQDLESKPHHQFTPT